MSKHVCVCHVLTVCCVSVAHSADFQVQRLPEPVQEKTRFLNADYLVATPESVDAEANLPVLIFLHGAGGRGEDIEKVKRIAKPALTGMEQFAGEPCFLVAPQALNGTKEIPASWVPDDLDQFLQHLKATLPVDESRIYLTGTSMGGYGTWVWSAQSPQQFAAVAPVVGGLGKGGPKDVTPNLDEWAASLATIPVWAFHGADDKVVPAERSERMIKLIKENGGQQARLTIYPGEGHGAGRRVYTSREFFEWMFAQRSSARPTSADTQEPQ